jgi:hypothetical protein
MNTMVKYPGAHRESVGPRNREIFWAFAGHSQR